MGGAEWLDDSGHRGAAIVRQSAGVPKTKVCSVDS